MKIQKSLAKEKLKLRFGSLRIAAHELGYSRFILSDLLNGWRPPTKEDLKKLNLTEKDFLEKIK